MKDLQLSNRGKAAYASLCVACCGFPMLVVLGFLSLGAAFAIGVSLTAAIGVAALAYLVVRHKTGHIPAMLPRALGFAGVVLVLVAFFLAGPINIPALTTGIALLASSALLVLSKSEMASSPA